MKRIILICLVFTNLAIILPGSVEAKWRRPHAVFATRCALVLGLVGYFAMSFIPGPRASTELKQSLNPDQDPQALSELRQLNRRILDWKTVVDEEVKQALSVKPLIEIDLKDLRAKLSEVAKSRPDLKDPDRIKKLVDQGLEGIKKEFESAIIDANMSWAEETFSSLVIAKAMKLGDLAPGVDELKPDLGNPDSVLLSMIPVLFYEPGFRPLTLSLEGDGKLVLKRSKRRFISVEEKILDDEPVSYPYAFQYHSDLGELVSGRSTLAIRCQFKGLDEARRRILTRLVGYPFVLLMDADLERASKKEVSLQLARALADMSSSSNPNFHSERGAHLAERIRPLWKEASKTENVEIEILEGTQDSNVEYWALYSAEFHNLQIADPKLDMERLKSQIRKALIRGQKKSLESWGSITADPVKLSALKVVINYLMKSGGQSLEEILLILDYPPLEVLEVEVVSGMNVKIHLPRPKFLQEAFKILAE